MKDGTITTAETEALREEAIKLLQKLKQDPKEQKKVPIRKLFFLYPTIDKRI